MNKKAVVFSVLFCLFFGSCFKRHRPNENALLQQKSCIESIHIKDYPRAQIHCELCLEYDSSMPECLNGIGLIALTHADEPKAIKFFSRALRQDNDFSEARNNLGVIYFSHGEFREALKYFDRALEIDPSNRDARYNSGLSHLRMAERWRAKEAVKKSLHHLALARDQIKKLIALEPEFDHAYRDLGLIELNRYDLTEFADESEPMLKAADLAFSQCLQVNAENDGCYEGLGQVKTEQAKFDQAFAHYFLCLTHAPDNAACRKGIVFAYEKSAIAENSYKKFRETIAGHNSNAEAHEAFCAALFERGLKSEAQAECEMALKIKPKLCSAHFRLGTYFASVLNARRAVSHCQEYLWCEKTPLSMENQKTCQEIITQVQR
jgi:tetratricopeptide (TPR) repeat protein